MGCKLILFTKEKSHTDLRLVLMSVILNDLERYAEIARVGGRYAVLVFKF